MTKAQNFFRPDSRLKQQRQQPRVSSGELLFEIGVEELPYQVIVPALTALKDSAEQLFKDYRLTFHFIRTLGTPRRLTLVVEGLLTQQVPMLKESLGPSRAVAFDSAGLPTKAALCFAAGQGISVQALQIRQTAKGEYLFAVKQEPRRPTAAVLNDLLPQLIAKLSFSKAMQWNHTGVRFARPVRWLVALYGGATLRIEAAGLIAGNRTYGHRVLGHAKGIVVRDFASYLKGLEHEGVILDPQQRRQIIADEIAKLCESAGVVLNVDGDLLEQAVYTTEFPRAIIGSFKPAYLEVPHEILVTSMKEHQGFFSLIHPATKKLVPNFIAVINNCSKSMGLIREGNERVLAARLADAKFFFDEDRKVRLIDRVPRLAGVTFQQKLGTLEEKQQRIRQLVGDLASNVHPHDRALKQICERAADLCKTDLLTGVVGEFPELQGIMGGEYAKHDGESEAVSQALREQYLPKSLEGELPRTIAGQLLSLADRLDSIVAFFSVGLVPSGSEDPFALRRSATGIVRIILEGNLRINLAHYIETARSLVVPTDYTVALDTSHEGPRRVAAFILERVRYYGRVVYAVREDVIDAVLQPIHDKPLDLVDLGLRMKALDRMTAQPEFGPLIVGFKRVHRLVEKEQWGGTLVDPKKFQHPVETALWKATVDEQKQILSAMTRGEYLLALEALVRLKPLIDAFFVAVMVNADDLIIRSNRLSLLQGVDQCFASFADFSQIVIQGD